MKYCEAQQLFRLGEASYKKTSSKVKAELKRVMTKSISLFNFFFFFLSNSLPFHS